MVWGGVSFDGVTQLHFCEQGVKTRAINYQNDILKMIVKPLNDTLQENTESFSKIQCLHIKQKRSNAGRRSIYLNLLLLSGIGPQEVQTSIL